jgi:hypothetical protein
MMVLTRVHTRIHVYTHAHTYMHTYTRTYTYTHTRTRTRTRTHTLSLSLSLSLSHTHTYTIHAYMHVSFPRLRYQYCSKKRKMLPTFHFPSAGVCIYFISHNNTKSKCTIAVKKRTPQILTIYTYFSCSSLSLGRKDRSSCTYRVDHQMSPPILRGGSALPA